MEITDNKKLHADIYQCIENQDFVIVFTTINPVIL